jgi:ATP-binding cassette subfamily B multidrug efflux pump
MEGKTVVAIAHRLSTIAAMDRLIVMDKGRVVEEGTHRSLLAKGGLYARLWAHQSGGFLGIEDDDAIEVEQPASEGTIADVEREAARRPEEPSRIGHDLPTGSDPVNR